MNNKNFDYGKYQISVDQGEVFVEETTSAPDYSFEHIAASMFLFSFSSQYDGSYDKLPKGVETWLPLPICHPKSDNV